ncbi:MAG: Kazal-type serine protease inhibitor family protein [Candidatus ainarchaeum sp.]|nr:Kazal-type serine protease inhibitor family protein [Candidatus ainarchaeum sp.]
MRSIIVLSVLAVLMISGCLGQTCPDTYDPVCGSDSVTYANACQAAKAGATVETQGACVEETCSDSDGGKDIFSKGTATGRSGSVVDRCEDALQVDEAYCSGLTATSQTLPCPNGYVCTNGACVIAPCSDSDNGKNKTVKGTTTAQGESMTDECADSSSVTEYYCDGSNIANEEMACGTGMECANGACKEATCTDSDSGKDTSVAGTTKKGTETSSDSCVGTSSVKEYYCEANAISSETINCASGYSCTAGKCVKDVCVDSDGGKDQYEKGTTTYGTASYTDNCYSDTAVLEYFCSSDTSIMNEKISCGTGKECYNGLCRTAECQETQDQIDETDTRYQIAAFDDGDELTLYADDVVEINDEFILELKSVSATDAGFRLYENYAEYQDDNELCSVTIAEGANDEDLCGENTVNVEVIEVNDTEDNAKLVIGEYYATQYYTEEGLIIDWTDNPVCPDDSIEFDSHVSYFYPYLDTKSSGLNLDGKKFKLFGLDARINEVTVDTFTFEFDGSENEMESGDEFTYQGVDYEVTLTFHDGGLYKFVVEPA